MSQGVVEDMGREPLPYEILTTLAQTIFWAKGSIWSDLDAEMERLRAENIVEIRRKILLDLQR